MCKKTMKPLSGPQLVHAIKRNFGGLEDSDLDPFKEFCEIIEDAIEDPIDLHSTPNEVCYMYPELHVSILKDLITLAVFTMLLKYLAPGESRQFETWAYQGQPRN